MDRRKEHEGVGSYRPGNVMEQILLGTISKDIKDKKMICNSQLSMGKSCLANLIDFYKLFAQCMKGDQ